MVSVYENLYGSVGWRSNIQGVLYGEFPCNLDCNTKDAMIQFAPWWTQSHIKTDGSDSVSKTIVGEKHFLICVSYATTIAFNNDVETQLYFMELISRGSKASKLPSDHWYYISNKSIALFQPTL